MSKVEGCMPRFVDLEHMMDRVESGESLEEAVETELYLSGGGVQHGRGQGHAPMCSSRWHGVLAAEMFLREKGFGIPDRDTYRQIFE